MNNPKAHTSTSTYKDIKTAHEKIAQMQKYPSVGYELVETTKIRTSNLIKVKDFENYVKQAVDSSALTEQYESYARGKTDLWNYAQLTENTQKNRYVDLLAYDKTRVILEKLPGDPYSDYINASYIKGLTGDQVYVATQGPKTNTIVDFWRMIWQEDSRLICMMTNIIERGKVKCEQYWPNLNKTLVYGRIIVQTVEDNVFMYYTFRKFEVTYGDETRQVHHLHFTSWPDHGVPNTTHSVVSYLRKIIKTPSGKGPIVVHCSAGVGRTGSIIVAHICAIRALNEGVIDVFSETANVRKQRANLIDNEQQYEFVHLVLIEYLDPLSTPLPCTKNLRSKIKELKNKTVGQRIRLQERAWLDKTLSPTPPLSQLSASKQAKNRYPNLAADAACRIYLPRYPPLDEESDYISAAYVRGVRCSKQYIATQLPLPNTLVDFWRMISELEINLIIMLQAPDPNDPTCCDLVPNNSSYKPTPFITIKIVESVKKPNYTIEKLILSHTSESTIKNHPITILTCTTWKSGLNQTPPPASELVPFWQTGMSFSNTKQPVVILCHDGVTGCGLYLSMSHLLETMANDNECDVYSAVRSVRQSRESFVNSLEQLNYLHDAAIIYSERLSTYMR